MNNLTKKILCFILIISIFSANLVFAAEDDKQFDNLDNNVEFLKLLSEFLNYYYLYDISQENVINALYTGFLELAHEKADKEEQLDVNKLSTEIDSLYKFIKNTLSERGITVSDKEIATCLYKSLFSVLDDYSVYFTNGEYKDFTTTLSGEIAGIGVQISKLDRDLQVTYVFSDSPANKAGIAVGDIITEVDGVNIEALDLNSSSELIRGEVGTEVKLTIIRNNKKLNFTITRDLFTISSANGKILDNNIGYLKIIEFNDNTTEQVSNILAGFDEKKITKVIVDVRDNPGGNLQTVLDILNMFVEAGPVLYTQDSISGETCFETDLEKQKYNICVLVNENSASASEIFAGAIQDRNTGKIIGTTTYGKGVVQSLYSLKNEDAIKITTAEYFTPNKNKVQDKGITPDIIIENTGNLDLSEFPEFNKKRKPSVNDVGLDVLRAEMILKLLNYNIDEPDGVFDIKTQAALKQFQDDNGLYAYGVLDFTTQNTLDKNLSTYINSSTTDLQLEAAIQEILK